MVSSFNIDCVKEIDVVTPTLIIGIKLDITRLSVQFAADEDSLL